MASNTERLSAVFSSLTPAEVDFYSQVAGAPLTKGQILVLKLEGMRAEAARAVRFASQDADEREDALTLPHAKRPRMQTLATSPRPQLPEQPQLLEQPQPQRERTQQERTRQPRQPLSPPPQQTPRVQRQAAVAFPPMPPPLPVGVPEHVRPFWGHFHGLRAAAEVFGVAPPNAALAATRESKSKSKHEARPSGLDANAVTTYPFIVESKRRLDHWLRALVVKLIEDANLEDDAPRSDMGALGSTSDLLSHVWDAARTRLGAVPLPTTSGAAATAATTAATAGATAATAATAATSKKPSRRSTTRGVTATAATAAAAATASAAAAATTTAAAASATAATATTAAAATTATTTPAAVATPGSVLWGVPDVPVMLAPAAWPAAGSGRTRRANVKLFNCLTGGETILPEAEVDDATNAVFDVTTGMQVGRDFNGETGRAQAARPGITDDDDDGDDADNEDGDAE